MTVTTKVPKIKYIMMTPELYAGGGDDMVNKRTEFKLKIEHRSPFRYPGGKSWFIPYFRHWWASHPVINSLNQARLTIIEPFAGGASVALDTIAQGRASYAQLFDVDGGVAAVWRVIIVPQLREMLIDRIRKFKPTPKNVVDVISGPETEVIDSAFKTLVKNRFCYQGLMTKHARPMKRGDRDRGVASRWYPETIIKRIQAIDGTKFDFGEWDWTETLSSRLISLISHYYAVWFIDPPYTLGGKRPGRRLYNHYEIDHPHLFEIVSRLEGPWLMTYPPEPEVIELVSKHKFDMVLVPTRMNRLGEIIGNKQELVISRNLAVLKLAPFLHHRRDLNRLQKNLGV